MHLVVDARGSIERADVVHGTGTADVDAALAEAARSSEFAPCLLITGEPVRCEIALTLEYAVTRSWGRISSRLCALPTVLVGL
jgi:outer membrane biosynthesis protein TonB